LFLAAYWLFDRLRDSFAEAVWWRATETRRHRGRYPRITRITRIAQDERALHAAALRRPGATNGQKRKPSESMRLAFRPVRWPGWSAGFAGRRATRVNSVSLCLCGASLFRVFRAGFFRAFRGAV